MIIHKIYDEINSELEDLWLKLEKDIQITPFQSFFWISKFVKYYLTKKETLIFYTIIETKPHLNALVIIPLFLEIKFGIKVLKFIGQPFADYEMPIIGKNYELNELVMNEIFLTISQKYRIDAINFTKQLNYFDKRKNPFAEKAIKNENAIIHKILISESWEEYKRTHLERGFEKFVKSFNKKLKFNEKIEIVVNPNDQQIKNIIRFTIINKIKKLNKKKKTHILNKPSLKFLYKLFREKNIHLHRSCLLFNNKIIATHLGFVYKNIFYYIFPAYDEEFKHLSPGKYLLLELIKYCHNSKLEIFDLTFGNEAYKKKISNYCERYYSLTKIFTFKGKIYYIFLRLYSLIKNNFRIKSN